jgi:hypothetical protein
LCVIVDASSRSFEAQPALLLRFDGPREDHRRPMNWQLIHFGKHTDCIALLPNCLTLVHV